MPFFSDYRYLHLRGILTFLKNNSKGPFVESHSLESHMILDSLESCLGIE